MKKFTNSPRSDAVGKWAEKYFEILMYMLKAFLPEISDVKYTSPKPGFVSRLDIGGVDLIIWLEKNGVRYPVPVQIKSSPEGVAEYIREKKDRYGRRYSQFFEGKVLILWVSESRDRNDRLGIITEILNFCRNILDNKIQLQGFLKELSIEVGGRKGVSNKYSQGRPDTHKEKLCEIRERELKEKMFRAICSLPEMRAIQNEIERLESHLEQYPPKHQNLIEMRG